MDNLFSQPTLKLPAIPDDFEATAGATRLDFAKALFKLLASATIEGINPTSPQSFDVSNLIQRIQVLEANHPPKMRAILKAGVTDTTLVVGFADIGTSDYFVNVEFVTPDAGINTVTWSVVDGSKTSNEVKVRIDGNASTYQIIITIVENLG